MLILVSFTKADAISVTQMINIIEIIGKILKN